MRRTADVALVVLIVACLAAMLSNASLGLLAQASGGDAVPAGPPAGVVVVVLGGASAVAACILIFLAIALAQPDDKRRARRRGLIAAGALVATAALCWAQAPVRIAFAASRGEFDQFVATLPASPTDGQTSLRRRVGLYEVNAFAVDDAGGKYFRVGSSSLLETTSWGFCIRPNPRTSPFGAGGYSLTALGGGWYWFTANDDWY